MKNRIRRIIFVTRSAFFTVVLHAALIAALIAGLWWPFSQETVERGVTEPIQARTVSADEIQQAVDRREQKAEEKKRLAEELEQLKIKQEQEKKKLEELEKQKQREEQKRKQLAEQQEKEAVERKRKQAEQEKLEAERKKAEEAEKQRQLEAQREKEEAERKKKEEEQKRLEAERQRKAEEKRQQELAEKRAREEALKKQLAEEQYIQTQSDAASALGALVDRIALQVENNWRRPLNSTAGLVAIIAVRVSRNGEVLSANVVKSSGDKFFDQSAEVAIRKASPLPFPSNPKYYEFIKEFNFKFAPDA